MKTKPRQCEHVTWIDVNAILRIVCTCSSNRDRNREHAKNTRLRKKCYVKKLRELVDRMHAQREGEERERRALGQRIYDTVRTRLYSAYHCTDYYICASLDYRQHMTRKNVVRLFLTNCGLNVAQRDRWSCILDENITLTLPVTPYRSFDPSQVRGAHRVVRGIDAVMADAASLAVMAETLNQDTDQWREAMKR